MQDAGASVAPYAELDILSFFTVYRCLIICAHASPDAFAAASVPYLVIMLLYACQIVPTAVSVYQLSKESPLIVTGLCFVDFTAFIMIL